MQEFKKFLEVLRKDDPKYLAELLLLELVDSFGAQTGCVYILNLLNNSFLKKFCYGGDHMPRSIDLESVKTNPILNKAVLEIETYADAENLLVPIYRSANNKKYCLGFLHLQHHQIVDEEKIRFIQDISVIFNQVFRNLFINNLLKNANHPIGFKQSRDEYYKDLVQLISKATRLPLIALREYDESSDTLNCISSFGFENNPPDFTRDNIPPIFKATLTIRKTMQTAFGDNFDDFPELAGLGIVQIILLPILVGDFVWGIMSMATRYDYFFSESELLGLETVAHGIGVSINNYHNFHNSNAKLFQFANNATLVTGIEIAQAVRHEAKNILSESQTKLVRLEKVTDKIEKSYLIEGLSKKLLEVHNSLDKIRSATKPPKRVLSKVNLKIIWEDSIEMLQGRLTEHDIKVRTIGNLNIHFNAFQDWLRHAFLNLLLNSIDAYKDRSKKNREIVLSLDSSSEPDKISLTYMDNAGGIELQKLANTELISEEIKNDLNQLIFQPNVTSKDEGSGYGLYLTRLTIQEYHKGTINLVNHRGGVIFSIKIPLNL